MVATAYLDFAAAYPAVYEAMFTLPLDATFGRNDSEPELLDAFEVLHEVVSRKDSGHEAIASADATAIETDAKVFWAALHGLSTLDRAGRLRPPARAARIHHLAARFGHASPSPS